MSAAPADNTKSMIGTYELVRRLGVGGMGEVWLARQRGAAGFKRDVAIKRLLPQAMEQTDVVNMFIEEAQITGRLRHPNVVGVIELGAAESGELYLVLEHVDGVGLHKLLRDKDNKPTVSSALAIGRDVALALHSAHTLKDENEQDLGLVHRDVTPSNVMIDKLGHIKLMDFGIAKVRAKSNQTEAGIIKGKIAYLAPEQLKGSVDPRSDLFALGLVVWETIAGQQARSASSDAVLMAKVALEEIPSIRTVRPDLPENVIAAVDKAVALDPDKRYQDGEEMAAAMLATLESLTEKNRMESAREELGSLVKAAMKKEGEAGGANTNASRTIDGGRPVALTLHSLVVQEGDLTISRPLSVDMIKAQLPPDARTSGGRRVGKKKKSSAAFPIVAALGATAIVGAMVVLRKPPPTNVPVVTAPRNNTQAANAPPPVVNTPPVAPIPTPAAVPDAGPSTATTAAAAGARANDPHARDRNRHDQAAAHEAPIDPNATGTLGVAANPWATVSIDGRPAGTTPLAPRQVQAGAHTVTAVNSQLDTHQSRRVTVHPGERLVVRFDMTRAQ